MTHRPTHVNLRPLAFACALLASLAPVTAETAREGKPWPGHTLRTATALEGIAGAAASGGNPVPLFGMRGSLAEEGLFAPSLALEASIGYRWFDEDGSPLPLPGAALAAGYRVSLPGLFSVTPLAGAGIEAACHADGAESAFQLLGGVRLSFLLDRGDYLAVTPLASLPLSGGVGPSLSLAIGLRSETPWMLPAPAQRPRVRPEPALFSPDADGVDDTTAFRLSSADRSLVARWSLEIVDPDGKRLKRWEGTGKPPRAIAWDGQCEGKAEFEPGLEYRATYDTVDALGRADRGTGTVVCDILVIKDGERYKVRVPDINFPSDSWELSPRESRKLLEANRKTLDRIATLFARFPDYRLTVEGYANAVNWTDKKRLDEEQRKELLPLSQKRADAVKAALVMLGIDESRIGARGLGGSKPVAEFSDARSAWKNRRVEFILEK